MDNLELYVKYSSYPPVKIETHYIGEEDRKRPLKDVSDLILAYKTLVSPLLDSISITQLTLHLPSTIEKDTFPEDYYSSGDILRPGLLLSHLKNISDDRHPLIIKTIQPTTQGIFIITHE